MPFPSDRLSILVVLPFAAILWAGSITCRVLRREASRVRHRHHSAGIVYEGSVTQLGNGNDLGFRLNGFPSCPSSLSFGPSGTAHVTRSRTSASVEKRSASRASSATRGKKEHFCDRYHIANANGGATQPLECSGALVPNISGSMESDCGATTKAPQRGKGSVFFERRSSILVPSRRCAQPVVTDGWRTVGTVGGRS